MKAFLLAAGYGTRLRPITENIPKCMVPIRGRPLLEWWFELLCRHGISQVLVNTHYLPEYVDRFIRYYNRQGTGLTAHSFFEKSLMGSGGTVRANKAFIGDDEDFIICYADNLTNINLTELMSFHRAKDCMLTMALFHTDNPTQCGIATLDRENRIIAFEEKPMSPASNLANAGIYAARRELLDVLPDNVPLDFGKDVLPCLTGHMHGYEITDYLIDIGTLENYRRAEEEWDHDHYKNPFENQLYGRGD